LQFVNFAAFGKLFSVIKNSHAVFERGNDGRMHATFGRGWRAPSSKSRVLRDPAQEEIFLPTQVSVEAVVAALDAGDAGSVDCLA